MRLCHALAASAALSLPCLATAGFTGTVDGQGGATLTGTAGEDVITLSGGGGFLEHDRFGIDPGFESRLDFDSSAPGLQTITDDPASIVVIDGLAGADAITLGTDEAGAHLIRAIVRLQNTGGGDDLLQVNFAGAPAGNTYTHTSSALTGPFVQFQRPGVFSGGINLTMSEEQDNLAIASTFASEPLSVNGRAGADVVTIGSAGNAALLSSAPISISNSMDFTTVIVDASTAAAGLNASINPPNLSLSSGQQFTWTQSDLAALELLLGAGDDAVTVLGVAAGAAADFIVRTADGNDTVQLLATSYPAGTVTVDTGSGNDEVFYADSGNKVARLNLDGGSNGAPGDTLRVDANGRLMQRQDGRYTFSNGVEITHTAFENLAFQDALTVRLSMAAADPGCPAAAFDGATSATVPFGQELQTALQFENFTAQSFDNYDLVVNGFPRANNATLNLPAGGSAQTVLCGGDGLGGPHQIDIVLYNGGAPGAGYSIYTQVAYLGPAEVLAAVTENNLLFTFSASDPAILLSQQPITGLAVDERILALDYNGEDGVLYGLTTDDRFVRLSTATAQATPVTPGAGASILSDVVGLDMNATTGRFRVITSDGQNLRFASDGIPTGTDPAPAFAPGDPNDGKTPRIEAIAHTDPQYEAPTTILQAVDTSEALRLLRATSPNSGVFQTGPSIRPAFTPALGEVGFDISPAGAAYLLANNHLLLVSLEEGGTSDLGSIGNTAAPIVAVAAMVEQAPIINVGDITVTEGDSGFTQASVPVTLSRASSLVSFAMQTEDGTAQSPGDFTEVNLPETPFPAGTTTFNFTVPVRGDTVPELTEALTARLTTVRRALIGKDTGTITIRNDDVGAPVNTLLLALTPEVGDDFNEDGLVDAADAVAVGLPLP
jgi:hypothetical protein